MKEGVQTKTCETQNKKKEQADMIKYEKMEGFEQANMVKQQEQLKNASLKQMVRNQEQELADRKFREQQERKIRGR